MYILLILILLILTFLFLNVVASTEYKDGKFKITVTFLKIKLFSNVSPKKKKVDNKKKESKEKTNDDKLTLENLGEYFSIVKLVFSDIKKVLRYFKRKIKCNKFQVDITFGLSDAAETGIATGMFWALIGTVYPVIDSSIDIKNPEISVNPKFNTDMFDIEYKGIYKLKIIHIIYVGICGLLIFKKIKNYK